MRARPQSTQQPTPQTTLEHFLKLALAQLHSRLRANDGGVSYEVRRMRLLGELIKEQLPNEDTSSATGSPR